MRQRRFARDTKGFIALALLAAAANLGPGHIFGHARQILSVPLLVGPGWTLSRVLFPTPTLRVGERLMIAGCMALAALVIMGLALNALPGGLTHASWSWSLIGVTLAAAGVSAVARPSPVPAARVWDHVNLGTVAGGLAALAVLAAGFLWATRTAATHDRATQFTELWMLPGSAPGVIRYGVTNRQDRRERYKVTAFDQTNHRILFRKGSFALTPGQTSSGRFSVAIGRSAKIVLDLDMVGETSAKPYRSTWLLVPGGGG